MAWFDELIERTGVRRVALFLDVSADDQKTDENMARFAADVAPRVRTV